ncbi:MAG: SulP family inorganic anion transporter [Acidimicrobiales bacterium]
MGAFGRDGLVIRRMLAPSLRGYQRSWMTADLLAGMTLLVIAVPEQLATSRLADMPAATALWAFVAATFAFFLFGSSKVVSVGADSTIAPLFAAAVARLSVSESPHAIALTSLIALSTGGLILIVGMLRLGWIADFLSVPIITGFMAGVAAIITIHQLPDILGAGSASGSLVHRIHEIFAHLKSVNGWSVGIGVVVLVIMVGSEKIDSRIPAALIGLIGSTILVVVEGLGHHGVQLLGPVATGLPKVGIPSVTWSDLGTVLPVSLTIALVCLGQTAATVRSFTDDDDPKNMDHDFVALGAGNILSGFAGSFPVDASPARTSVVASARGKTQAACLFAALVIAIASPAADQLRRVPLACLAAILLFVATRLLRIKDFKRILHFSRMEFGLAVITAIVVAFVGVEQGIALAVLLAVFDRAWHTARPKLLMLGRVPGTTSWTSLGTKDPTEGIPGVEVVLFAGPLYFANAGEFHTRVNAALSRPAPLDALVIDAAGMGDIDFTGASVLHKIVGDLEARGIQIAFARAGPEVIHNLEQSGIVKMIGSDRLFDTVDEAATAMSHGQAPVPTEPHPEGIPLV